MTAITTATMMKDTVQSQQGRVAAIDAFVVAAPKDYVGDAGLESTGATETSLSCPALFDPGDLHIASYPAAVQTCLVKITTDTGLVGWGEAHAPLGARATKAIIDDVLAPILLDQDPLAIERHWDRMYASMRLRGHVSGYQLEAISGVDIALWDLAGKLLNLPIYRLLGGPCRPAIPTYASGVPGRTIEERITNARQLVARGYRTIKASIGRGDIEADLLGIERLAASVKGQAQLLVDAHGAYSADSALVVGRRLETLGVGWFEDPLPPEDIDGYARLADALDMAVAAGETECTRWQFADRLRAHAVDVILPDICRAGGITEGRKIATIASVHNVRWAAHVSMGTSVHLAAAAQLAAASGNFLVLEYPSTPNPLGEDLLVSPFHPESGMLALPQEPGLGIEFDEARLALHVQEESPVDTSQRKVEHV